MIVMAGAIALTAAYLHWRKEVLRLPQRYGATWETLLRRMKYKGSRKQKVATRKVLVAIKESRERRGVVKNEQ